MIIWPLDYTHQIRPEWNQCAWCGNEKWTDPAATIRILTLPTIGIRTSRPICATHLILLAAQ
jgi:hypothetical protein